MGATRTKLKISTMMSVGDLEESIFLRESVIRGHHIFKDVWLTLTTFYLVHVLNKPCCSTGRKYALNKCLITRVCGMLIKPNQEYIYKNVYLNSSSVDLFPSDVTLDC